MEKINLDEREAAAKYGPSVHWFRRARWAGGGPRYIKLAGRVLYPVVELDRFFNSRIRTSTSDSGHVAGITEAIDNEINDSDDTDD